MNKSNLISLLCLIGIIVIGVWLTYPLLNQLKNVNLTLAAKNNEVKLMEDKINNLNTLKTDFNKYQTQVKFLAAALPTEDQMPEILVQTEALAKKSGLEVTSIQPGKTVSSGETGLNMSTKGSFSSTLDFLQNLEKNARPAQVKSMNISSSQAGDVTVVSTTFTLGFIKAQ